MFTILVYFNSLNYLSLMLYLVNLLPLIMVSFLSIYITTYLYISLWNIFKVFFFTESMLLISVLFLTQCGSILNFDAPLHYFYCQLILASAAAEAALFLGIFSHLYDRQFTNWVTNLKQVDSSLIYFINNSKLKNVNSSIQGNI